MSRDIPAKKLSAGKRALGVLFIVMVIVVGGLFGLWITGTFEYEDPSTVSEEPQDLIFSVVVFVFAFIAFAIGLAGYYLVLCTCCFTNDFSRPFFRSLKAKLYVANIVVSLFIVLGLALFVSVFIRPILLAAGISPLYSFMIPAFGAFFILNFVLMWFQIWAPLEKKVIARRLGALGIPLQYIQTGTYIGVSDPTKSSFKKMTLVEDDCGMLWVTPTTISYRGDTETFDIQRDQLIEVERRADAGDNDSLAGVVNVIMKIRQDDGQQRSIRLHCEGCWTQSAKARAMDRLTSEITQWQENLTNPTT
ncbi:MAG: hypothetical protein ACYTF1_15850 [Planctomycetota bacterium]|jgi:hypothetical protein